MGDRFQSLKEANFVDQGFEIRCCFNCMYLKSLSAFFGICHKHHGATVGLLGICKYYIVFSEGEE